MKSIIGNHTMKFLAGLFLTLSVAFAYPAKVDLETPFIAGGDPAEEGQFPFQIGLRTYRATEDGQQYSAWCGGSLIADNVVLTAAHCVINGLSAEVLVGAADLSKENHKTIEVKKEAWIIHDEYHKNDHDIALIILPSSLSLNERINTVNLPRRSQQNKSFEKEVGWISGWGRLGDGKGSPEQLQYTRRWILPHANCEYYYPGYFRSDLQVCVDGSHGISSCAGDSGGPLTVEEEDGSRTLVGLTSYGMIYCEKGFPSVYTRVTPHLDWIHEKTGIAIRE